MTSSPPENALSSTDLPAGAPRTLALATFAWTICFAAWTIFSIIGLSIQQQLALSETQFGLLISAPILTGSIGRLLLGILSERVSPRLVTAATMLVSAAGIWLITLADSYALLLAAAFCIGLAGAVFITGISLIARWFPQRLHGSVFGLFGLGNLGAAITNFGAPLLLAQLGLEGTARIYAACLAVTAVIFWLLTRDEPAGREPRASGRAAVSLSKQLEPLRYPRVWRFGIYYFFVFGGFVALASWLPRYYMGVYGLDIAEAGMLAAVFSFSAAIFRALGGWLSDRVGARTVMYWTFAVSLGCLLLLSYPPTTYVIHGIHGPIEFTLRIHLVAFVALSFVLGLFMSLGMAAVYKHIPAYYPAGVGTVGGLVAMIGGLGGFVMPIVFGVVNQVTGIWTTSFMTLFALVLVNLVWMHFAILRMQQRIHPDLARLRDLPEGIPAEVLEELHRRYGRNARRPAATGDAPA